MAPRPGTDRLRAEELELLKLLATAGSPHTPVLLSSREVGDKLGVSQQAADRYLVALAEAGLLTRSMAARRQRLSLTAKGIERLRRQYHSYRRLFEGPQRLRLEGTVSSGLGEGRYYLSQPGYVVQFSERLGYTPYPGTLNVKVPSSEMVRIGALKDWAGTRIDGFQASGRTFGGATCYRAHLGGRACHLIIPDRTHHTDVLEFISSECLRDRLKVKDGDRVVAEIEEG